MNWPSIRLLYFPQSPSQHKKPTQAAFNLEKIYKAKINFQAFPIRNSTTPRNFFSPLSLFFSVIYTFFTFSGVGRANIFSGFFFLSPFNGSYKVIRKTTALFFRRRILTVFIESQLSVFFFFISRNGRQKDNKKYEVDFYPKFFPQSEYSRRDMSAMQRRQRRA
jgi:hypothetical protein